jgi:glycosyltransferase involved in cell wall biosynthesis
MRIVLDARMVKMSGIGRYIDSLIPFLASNYSLTLLGNPAHLEKYGAGAGMVQIISASSKPYSPFEQLELPLKIPPADIFWTPHFNAPVLPVRAAKRIVTVHDVFHLTGLSKDNILRRSYARLLYSNAVNRSDLVFTISEYTKKEIERYFPGLSDKKLKAVRVISRYSDRRFRNLGMNDKEKEDFLSSNSLPSRFALFVGNIKPHKNIAGLLRAFAIVRKKDPELSLLYVGQKDNFLTGFSGMQGLLESLGLRDSVFFTGIIDDASLVAIYNSAQVLVLPSFYEGFGLPPLEAMACGCPVVSSDIPSLREVCMDAALYVNPYSDEEIAGAVLRITADAGGDLRQRLVESGYKRAGYFSQERIENEYKKSIESLLGKDN